MIYELKFPSEQRIYKRRMETKLDKNVRVFNVQCYLVPRVRDKGGRVAKLGFDFT